MSLPAEEVLPPEKMQPPPAPVPGERWQLNPEDASPWPCVETPLSVIREVREGWVRYAMIAPRLLPEQHMEVSSFVKMYHRVM